jgi:hypothetical protein
MLVLKAPEWVCDVPQLYPGDVDTEFIRNLLPKFKLHTRAAK